MVETERVELAYGKGTVSVDVPERSLVKVFRTRPWKPLPDPQRAVGESLRDPIGSAPLAEIARNRKNAVVVISDITRPVPNSVILPPILATLESSGIPRDEILILIATGMHRPNEGTELVELVGEEIAHTYRIENHFGTDLQSHADLGISEEGVPLLVDRRYVEADLKVVTGLIEPHVMAGYSGGRKGVLPGICSLETMKVMHGYRMMQHPLTTVGRIDDNPFHQTALKLARRVGVDFIVNVTLNGQREITGIFSGDLNDAHRAGIAELEQHVVDEVGEPVDIAVTCAGGYPLDQTFYQSVKGTLAAREILKQGGDIVLAAHLGEGMGSPSFTEQIHSLRDPREFLDSLVGPDFRQLDQWMVQDHCNMLLHASQTFVFSENMPPEELESALVEPVSSVNEGLEKALEHQGRETATVAVLPEGPYVVATVREVLGA